MTLDDPLDRIKDRTIYEGECFVYSGADYLRKYDAPRVRFGDGRRTTVPKYVFERFVEKLRGDNIVCHTCDNPRCWNIKHLYQGTQSTNNHDMLSRGRGNSPKGTEHYKSVLSLDTVIDIKTRLKYGGQPKNIANKLQLDVSLVRHIAANQSWTHVVV